MLRGFARLSPEDRQRVARKGGIAAQALGRGHRFNSATAQAAGRKGGSVTGLDRKRMQEIGRKGGLAASKSKEK